MGYGHSSMRQFRPHPESNDHHGTELENAVQLVDSSRDSLYRYDPSSQKAQQDAKPWRTDPHHFKSIRISAVALIKMVMHARSGGDIEVMGLMQGYVSGDAFVVTDAFRLPVEGTETRVNAQESANEYMVSYLERSRNAGQLENAVGWYHSHPGYGCWLSGIDVGTQMNQQMFQDPFVAVVIDPDRTISAGRVEIGAFRTIPENRRAEGGGRAGDDDGFQNIPLAKVEDFGAYASHYYALEVAHFKSSLDARLLEALWNKYWVGTLSSSPHFANRDYGTRQIADLAMKIRQADKAVGQRSRGVGGPMEPSQKSKDDQLGKVVMAGDKIVAEEEAGAMAGKIREGLFCGFGVRRAVETEAAPTQENGQSAAA